MKVAHPRSIEPLEGRELEAWFERAAESTARSMFRGPMRGYEDEPMAQKQYMKGCPRFAKLVEKYLKRLDRGEDRGIGVTQRLTLDYRKGDGLIRLKPAFDFAWPNEDTSRDGVLREADGTAVSEEVFVMLLPSWYSRR